ncbi:hypothetical protein [Burkholderia pseudomallei]|uniref:hypothetical protein n=1 Tax=Burkholderia pseudomallei TaxID=28450 RepID=UPI0013253A3D|nr:hypothetical protein [Burkholderia pseudomallei]MWA18073.1 hypothetical protein [Burkholderia pseudomallei]
MTTTENNRADALIDERIEDAIYRHIPPKIALENAKALYAMAVELLVASPVEQFAPSPLTERDYDLHEHEQGLYRKFDVRRVDGSSEPGGKHHDCEYFVLDMTHDQHARAALRAYADACASTHPELSADLIARYALAPIEQPAAAPIPMLLFCPKCGEQHIDAPEPADADIDVDGTVITATSEWANPPHRSHLCHACGIVWRPADVATVGVQSIETHGKADTWSADMPWTGHNRAAPSPADERAASFETWCDRFPEISAVARLRDAWQETRAALPEDRIDWIANTHCPGGTAYPVNVKNAIREALREARISDNETGAEGAIVGAWLTEDGRAISAEQKAGMLRDGGAGASSVQPYSIPCYLGAASAMAAEAVAFEITEQAAAEWASRHDVDHVLKHFSTQRNAIEDARTLHLLAAAPQPAQAGARVGLTDAARDVLDERHRQIYAEGWTPAHDDQHDECEMALAAIVYAESAVGYHPSCPDTWPWSPKWFKPTTPRRDLVKAGALILAELERLDRAALLNGADHDQ